MGQYQQWLQYRHNERHLKAQLEELADELAQLQQREQELRQALQPPTSPAEENAGTLPLLPLPYNSVIRALAVTLNSRNNFDRVEASNDYASSIAPNGDTYNTHNTHDASARTNQTQQWQSAETNATISQALYSQSHLPNNMIPYTTDPEASRDAFQPLLDRNNPLPPIPYSDPVMLPEDMGAFLDEHTETEPRVALPWWLHNAGVLNPNGLVDPESARTNRLVQRWIERWGRHPIEPNQAQPPENGGKASS